MKIFGLGGKRQSEEGKPRGSYKKLSAEEELKKRLHELALAKAEADQNSPPASCPNTWAAIEKTLLNTSVLDFIPFGSPFGIKGKTKTLEKTFALVY